MATKIPETDKTISANTNEKGINSILSDLGSWKWRPTSVELLAEAEARIFSRVKTSYKGNFVAIDGKTIFDDSGSCQIWTISMNEQSEQIPIVLLHGLGAAAGFWCLNFDTLASTRPVYAIDNIGFGRSSRPKFSTDPAKASRQFVETLEAWREKMNLHKFILVGHSLGGYIVTSYALSYPQRISHLILCDPWGLTEKESKNVPLWIRAVSLATQAFNPFSAIRVAGPLVDYGHRKISGQGMMEMAFQDLIKRFSKLNADGNVKFGEYLYHCNAQKPSGEVAFRTMMDNYRWARLPLFQEIPNLSSQIPMTVIWGSKSFIPKIEPEDFKKLRNESYVNVQILHGVGHDVYSEGKDEFNCLVLEACLISDAKE